MSFIARAIWCREQQWGPFLQTSVRCLTGDPWQTLAPGRCAVFSSALEDILWQPCISRWSLSQEQISTRTATLHPFSSLWRQPLDLSQCELPGGGGHPTAGVYSPVSCDCGLPAAFAILVSLPGCPSELNPLKNLLHTRVEGMSCLLWSACCDANVMFIGTITSGVDSFNACPTFYCKFKFMLVYLPTARVKRKARKQRSVYLFRSFEFLLKHCEV